jgi:NO-binding membrane sensor protein with MHYT domain
MCNMRNNPCTERQLLAWGWGMLTVHNFEFGLLTPVTAYVMSCQGAFLGLRCAARARAHQDRARLAWLVGAAVSIGALGIWVMHFIAMLGFAVPGETIRYNVPVTLLSMVIAVVVVFTGLLIAASGRQGPVRLVVAGTTTGLGVASMHYTGMAAMRMRTGMSYDRVLFALSVLIAIVAATAALWAALRLRGASAALAASLIMGVAVSGMHYTGMAAMRVWPAGIGTPMAMDGATAGSFLLPLIIAIAGVAFVLTATIAMSPSESEIHEEAAMLARARASGLDI